MPVREEKARRVEELRQRMSRARALVLAEFRGLTVEQQTRLRRELRQAGVEFTVVKNTLTRIAAQQAGIQGLEPFLVGPTAVAMSYDDPVAPARELVRAMRELRDQLGIKAGWVEGRLVGPDEIRRLAELPSRQELLARVAGGLQAPLAGFAGVLTGLLRSLVYVLEQVRQQREAA